jgi:RNA polymerase sigma-70 factor (ECF subfamily)
LTRTARRHHAPGPYQLQAAIAACHAEAATWDDTDWRQILMLYDMLLHLQPSPITRLHRAVAVRYVGGVEQALSESDNLAAALDRYPLFHAVKAQLLRDTGDTDQALEADQRALELTSNPAQQHLLHERIVLSQ